MTRQEEDNMGCTVLIPVAHIGAHAVTLQCKDLLHSCNVSTTVWCTSFDPPCMSFHLDGMGSVPAPRQVS